MLARLGFTLAALLLPTALLAQQVHVYQTSSDLSNALAPQPDLRFSAEDAQPASPAITVDDTQRYQTIDGFGASMTDGAAWLLYTQLSPAAREQVMVKLFDPKGGIGLSFLRQPIGASDLSRDHTSFDDMPAGQQDPQLLHFSASHDDAYIFPAVREALRLNPAITVMATPWSPPAWMKTGSHPEPGAAASGATSETMNGGTLRPEDESAYAAYLVRSVEAFQSAGIPVKYLTVQNEPLHDANDFPSTLLLAAQAKELIGRYLGPDLRQAGLKTQVLAFDHNWNHIEYPEEVLADPAATPYLAGSALHCYGGTASAQTTLHDRYPSEGIWMTECSGGTWQRESPLLVTAHLLLDVTRNWGKSVVLWGIALDTEHNPHAGGCGTCRGLVTVDLKQTPPAVTYTGDYYALGHASHFIFPGATRIASSDVPAAVAPSEPPAVDHGHVAHRDAVETVAFQNTDGSIALLVLNNQSTRASFSVRWRGLSFATQLPAGVLATYTWRSYEPDRRDGRR